VKGDGSKPTNSSKPQQASSDQVALQLAEDPSKVDWRDTNMANVGSDIDKMIRKFVAEGEPAWEGVGRKPEMKIWRIEQFKVVAWDSNRYGEFYNGDSYIVLNTAKKAANSEALVWDIYYWIGSKSTQDEYTAVAIKTVELDNWLDDAPVQHREVEGNESMGFKRLFGKKYSVLEGGVESGFKKVQQRAAKPPSLYQIKGTDEEISVVQVELTRNAMNTGDVFLLDDPAGKHLYLWQGKSSSETEKRKANAFATEIKATRGGKPSIVTIEQGDDKPDDAKFTEFNALLPHTRSSCGCFTKQLEPESAESAGADDEVQGFKPTLFRVSDNGGALSWSKVLQVGSGCCMGDKVNDKGKISQNELDTDDVFVLDAGFHLYIWTGKKASKAERVKALFLTEKYLRESDRPDVLPITEIKQSNSDRSIYQNFNSHFYLPKNESCCVVM